MAKIARTALIEPHKLVNLCNKLVKMKSTCLFNAP